MKTVLLMMFFSLKCFAMLDYPLQFGIGFESCYPNTDGQTQCEGLSPQTQEIKISLDPAPQGTAMYGYHIKSGIYRKIGYEASLLITHFENTQADDMLTLKVITWDLNSPRNRHEVKMEIFADKPENLNRVNLAGYIIGPVYDFSNVILSVEKSKK